MERKSSPLEGSFACLCKHATDCSAHIFLILAGMLKGNFWKTIIETDTYNSYCVPDTILSGLRILIENQCIWLFLRYFG